MKPREQHPHPCLPTSLTIFEASVWQMPQCVTCTSTSCGASGRCLKACTATLSSGPSAAKERTEADDDSGVEEAAVDDDEDDDDEDDPPAPAAAAAAVDDEHDDASVAAAASAAAAKAGGCRFLLAVGVNVRTNPQTTQTCALKLLA